MSKSWMFILYVYAFQRCITTGRVGPSGGLTDVLPADKLHKMFNELHKKRKCFTGECLMDWIQENCVDPGEH